MHPILLQIGPIVVRSYTLLLGLGLSAGLGIFYLRVRQRTSMADRWLDGALVALVIGVLGARLGYVASNWAFFQEHV